LREKLAKRYNERDIFTGIFIRFGTKNGYKHKEPTVLLQDIQDKTGEIVTDHLWFNYTKLFKQLWESDNLHPGNIIEFYARVKPYTKGYEKDEFDYKLSFPTQLKNLGTDKAWIDEGDCDPPFKYTKNYFNYSHPYYKLDEEEYTTIRGLDSLDDYELNQKIDAKRDYEIYHVAIIIKIESRKISSLSLEFLKKDCEYPGFEINSKQEFIDLINSFRKSKKSHVKLENDPEFAVYYQRKIKQIPKKTQVFSGFTKKTISLDKFIKGEN
jgi:hypothetical protein